MRFIRLVMFHPGSSWSNSVVTKLLSPSPSSSTDENNENHSPI